MSERIVSPGVFTRENDQSFLSQGVGEIGAAFVGPLKEGPAFIPTVVRSASEFEEIFGRVDGTYYTEYAIQNYLREAGSATVVRIAGTEGYTQDVPVAIKVTGTEGEFIVSTLHSTYVGREYSDFSDTVVTSGDSGSFDISGSFLGLDVDNVSVVSSNVNSITNVFGESPFGNRRAYTYSYFRNRANSFATSADAVVSFVDLGPQDFSYEATVAHTPWVKSQLISDERYELFRFHTIGHGNVYNRKWKVSISNVKAAGESGGTDYSTFTVTLRSFSDTDRRKLVTETFNNVTLDPASPNYIARVIGDRYVTIDEMGKVVENGDYPNKSKYLRVEVAEQGSFPVAVAPFGHGAYELPISAGLNAEFIPTVVYQTGSAVNTAGNPLRFSGIDLETVGVRHDNHQYLNPIPENAGIGLNEDFGFEEVGFQMTGSDSADMVRRQFTLAFQGGFDGVNPNVPNLKGENITSGNSQGFDLTPSGAGTTSYLRAIRTLSNADEWDINMLVTPGVIGRIHSTVTQAAVDMVESRQDCFYIADFAEVGSSIADVTETANSYDTNYTATYYPWVRTIDNNTNRLLSVPPSVLLPAVYAANDRLAAEWFAPAGLTRGGIPGAISVLNRLTHTERDTLYENKVNPIASFPNQGIVAFGQKTLQDKASALDRINVRRLLINVKKFIASTSRFLVFEQNTSTTRSRFINTVTPYLEAIQQRQGLYAFRVVMDESNNTPDTIDRNLLVGQLFLQPTKTAEFIVIDFNILPTGASFGD
jgi:hypothetical protein